MGPTSSLVPGKYLVKLSLAGYQTAWVQVVVKGDAEDEIVTVDTELGRRTRKKKEVGRPHTRAAGWRDPGGRAG